MAIVLEAAGERLLTSPLFAVAQSTATTAGCPASEMRDLLLSSLAAGNVMSLAMGNQSGGWDSVGVTSNETSTTTVLSGEARFVPFGFAAAKLLVVAQDASNTLTLWVVDPQQDGVFVEPTPTMDQTRPMASVRLEQAAVTSDQLLASHADDRFGYLGLEPNSDRCGSSRCGASKSRYQCRLHQGALAI